MTRTQKKWAALAGLWAVALAGCSPGSLGWLLRDTKAKPEFPLPAKDGKKEVTVLVVASQPPGLAANPTFAAAARDFAAAVGGELTAETADGKHPIKVIDAAVLDRHKQTLADWRAVNPAVLGKQLGADYVIDAAIESVGIDQPEDAGELYAGRATVQVTVYDTARPDATLREYTHTSTQPKKATHSMSRAAYRAAFLKRLGMEVARRHVPYDTADRVGKLD